MAEEIYVKAISDFGARPIGDDFELIGHLVSLFMKDKSEQLDILFIKKRLICEVLASTYMLICRLLGVDCSNLEGCSLYLRGIYRKPKNLAKVVGNREFLDE